MSQAYICDVCKKLIEGAPMGGVVTTEGELDICGAECFLKAVQDQKVCTIGDLNAIQSLKTSKTKQPPS